jgi:hypothetical protein
VAGLPRKVSASAKRVVGIIVAVAAIFVIVVGLRSLRARQQRMADEARARSTQPVATAHKTDDVPPPPEPPSPAESQAPPPAETIATAPPSPGEAPAAAPVAAAAAAPAPPGPAAPARPGVALADPVPAPPAQEKPLDVRPEPAGSSLVAQANRALARGSTARAVDLARRAVAANPGDADAWLTLGAAYQASGNPAGARDAYRSCIVQAHSANVGECRVLAQH